MIRAYDLSCGYGEHPVLAGIDLHMSRGEMVGILGPNGSGKTTLIRAISGTLPLTTGRVRVDGHPLQELGPRQRARIMACIPQKLESIFDMRVASLVRMGRYPYVTFFHGYGPADDQAVTWALEKTRALHLADRFANELSGGELQRVLIARALAQQCPLLILDEAASGLDVGAQTEIHDLLKGLNAEGMTIVSVIHNLNLAALYCDRLVFLQQGRIVLDGPVDEVFTQTHLSRIYHAELTVFSHPVMGTPQCLPLPGNDLRPCDPLQFDIRERGCSEHHR
jgi:iron complex transport system ATP-binding protein